jgi:hypothetical protein
VNVRFTQLNKGWNAEPNAPYLRITSDGTNVSLSFFVNPYLYDTFREGEVGAIRFTAVQRFRYDDTNDEGWYFGQCRFSRLAPDWGEFYEVEGDSELLEAPEDWKILQDKTEIGKHFLFYFRDGTFECVAKEWIVDETVPNNALFSAR